MITIYKITNPANEVYIGQTSNYIRRVRDYKWVQKKDQPQVYESMIKYGYNNHLFSIAHELPDDAAIEIRDMYEQIYIDFYKDANFGLLNIKDGGFRGTHADSTKEKMRNAMTTSRIEGIRRRRLGGKHSIDTKEKIGRGCSKKIINSTSGKIYDSIKCAAKEEGVNYTTLRNYLCGQCLNKTTLKYL